MHIEFEKFLALTTLLAVGALAVPSCTVNNTTNNNPDETGGSAGAPSTARAGATNTPGAAGSTGVVNPAAAGNAGTESTLGAAGNAATPVGVAGAAGSNAAPVSVAGSAGVAVSPVAGSAGATVTPGVVAGAAGAQAAGAGGAAGAVNGVVAGAAGTPVGVAAGGAAGAANNVAVAGAAGAGACITGDPAAEGDYAVDCTALSYYEVVCDPSAEGGASPYGAMMCDKYAYSGRVALAQELLTCLKGLTMPAGGWCSGEHVAAVDACVAKVEQKTCPSDTAKSVCAAVNKACPSVKVDQCVADLSPLVDDQVSYIDPCMEGAALSTCSTTYYYYCAGFPAPRLKVSEVCAQLSAGCPALTASTCDEGLDPYATGFISKDVYELRERCMATYKNSGGTCENAFAACQNI